MRSWAIMYLGLYVSNVQGTNAMNNNGNAFSSVILVILL